MIFIRLWDWIRLRIPIGPKVLLINYYGGEANWGCKATSKGLITLLKKEFPNARIRKRPIQFVDEKDQEKLKKNPLPFDKNSTENQFLQIE